MRAFYTQTQTNKQKNPAWDREDAEAGMQTHPEHLPQQKATCFSTQRGIQTHTHTNTLTHTWRVYSTPSNPISHPLIRIFENYLVAREEHLHHKARTNSPVNTQTHRWDGGLWLTSTSSKQRLVGWKRHKTEETLMRRAAYMKQLDNLKLILNHVVAVKWLRVGYPPC